MQLNKKINKGFTLIELIVVISVFLFVIGAALAIFISITISGRTIVSEQQLLSQISYVQEHMSRAIRSAVLETNGNNGPDYRGCLTDQNNVDNPGYTYLLTRLGTDNVFNGIKFLDKSEVDSSGYPVCKEFYLDKTINVLKEKKSYFQVSSGSYLQANDNQAVALSSSNIIIKSIKFGINGLNGESGELTQAIDGGVIHLNSTNGSQAGGPNTGFTSSESNGNNTSVAHESRITIVIKAQISGEAQVHTFQTSISRRSFN